MADCIQITFQSLWPSLRSTIINEIQAAAAGICLSSFVPVLGLLGIDEATLASVMQENHKVWTTDKEIPAHLRELKRQFPDKAIDPDLQIGRASCRERVF